MAEMISSAFSDFLREARGPIVENFPKNHILHARLKRNTDRKNIAGSQLTVPLLLNALQGAQGIAEDGTVNEPHRTRSTQAVIDWQDFVMPIGISRDLLERARDTEDTSWKEALGMLIEQATVSMAKLQNESAWGDGSALLAACTASNTASTTVDVSTTASPANWRLFYVGRYVDIRTRSTGALVANGARRKINSISKTNGEIVLDEAVTTTSSEGVYVEGSYNQAFNGIQEADDSTGTFQSIARASFPQWTMTDGRVGSATDVDPTRTIMDIARREVEGTSGVGPSVWLGDEGVVDKFEQLLTSITRYAGERQEVNVGFEAVMYRNKPMFPDYDAPRKKLYGLHEPSMTLYAPPRFSGPDWDDLTGSRMMRFDRSLPVELWLVDMAQLGWHRLDSSVIVGNLNRSE